MVHVLSKYHVGWNSALPVAGFGGRACIPDANCA